MWETDISRQVLVLCYYCIYKTFAGLPKVLPKGLWELRKRKILTSGDECHEPCPEGEKLSLDPIADPFFSRAQRWIIAFAETLTVSLLLLAGAGYFLCLQRKEKETLFTEKERAKKEKETAWAEKEQEQRIKGIWPGEGVLFCRRELDHLTPSRPLAPNPALGHL